jgi:hypothetical protein
MTHDTLMHWSEYADTWTREYKYYIKIGSTEEHAKAEATTIANSYFTSLAQAIHAAERQR